MNKTIVKICGLKSPEAIHAALGVPDGLPADWIGFVFHSPSPRAVDETVAAYLAKYIPPNVKIVGLFVDPQPDLVIQILDNVRLDMIQLHGDESPETVLKIRDRINLPVMKALSIQTTHDVRATRTYEDVADWLLLDAKGTAESPGGGGVPFDWTLLENFRPKKPWMLAGGLTPENVGVAIKTLQPDGVDVSSGVESTRGVKDPGSIKAFIEAVRLCSV